jgi:hypothetical protein
MLSFLRLRIVDKNFPMEISAPEISPMGIIAFGRRPIIAPLGRRGRD